MRRRRARLFPLTLVAVPLVVALATTFCPRARADDAPAGDAAAVALAERRAAAAFQAYEKRDYAAAVALYLQAYEAAPGGSILYNVARIYDTKLGDRGLAMTFYRRYIADPGAQTQLIEEATRRLRVLRGADLTLSTDASSDASSSEAGTTPPRGNGLPRSDGDDVTGRQDRWSTMRRIGVVLAGAGLVGVAVGAGFGWSAMSKASTAHDDCDGNACTSQRGVDAAHAARTDAAISTIGFAMGGGLLATGATLFLLGGERRSEQNARAGVHVQAWATASDLSVRLLGSW